MLTTELINDYNLIINSLLHSQSRPGTKNLASNIEAIDDPMTDLSSIYRRDPDLLKYPDNWIDLIRILRFGILQNQILNTHYDSFVNSYQILTQTHDPDEDKIKLKEEIGILMYKIDDFNGKHERLLEKYMIDLASHILRAFQRLSKTDDFKIAKLDEQTKKHFVGLIEEIIALITNYELQIQISQALQRMSNLILDKN